MDTCKHDWHFIEGTERLRCERCKVETGPKTYEERVQDFLQESWTTEQVTVPTGQLYSLGPIKHDYNITFHNNLEAGGNGTRVGRMDFNGPEFVFEGDAAESAKVFMDCVATAFKGRLEEEREAGRQEALAQEPVAYLCENAAGHKYFRWKKPSGTYKPIALYTKEKTT